jgi:uncharacterized protein
VVVLGKGDEVVTTLTTFARDHRITAAHVTAIRAFSEVTLGFFDRDRRDYVKIPLREQVEVLSLIGDVALQDGESSRPRRVIPIAGSIARAASR